MYQRPRGCARQWDSSSTSGVIRRAIIAGVSAPNADTLYSLAWLDVGPEPMVFSHPDMGNRYYLFPMYSLWMPVIASPGRRTAGGKAAHYLITGPGWKGKVPAGMTQIKSPTRYLVVIWAAHMPTVPTRTSQSSTRCRTNTRSSR